MQSFALEGKHVRLEPLAPLHIQGLVVAAAADPSLYGWTYVPQGPEAVTAYIEAALAQRDTGTASPFAILRRATGEIIGSTRFYERESWSWPEGHPRAGRGLPDVCEIGYTWLTQSAIRTAANTEAKLLMLAHAFEAWGVLRVCLHTDERNQRSRAAIARIGARFEGILRFHKLASDHVARNSARFSIIDTEWSGVRETLERMRDRRPLL
jgi:RimJ/RimL family protein N-acetyltransferase